MDSALSGGLIAILAIAGLVISVVWIVFPFLVLNRLDRLAKESARQTELLRTNSDRLLLLRSSEQSAQLVSEPASGTTVPPDAVVAKLERDRDDLIAQLEDAKRNLAVAETLARTGQESADGHSPAYRAIRDLVIKVEDLEAKLARAGGTQPQG